MVLIGVESRPHVEILGAIDIGNRNCHQFELHVHFILRFSVRVQPIADVNPPYRVHRHSADQAFASTIRLRAVINDCPMRFAR